ncbi:hypothetical protein Golomagni_04500 [Golovinomyces magnicellulatus]|nr:hypothetical protein Golomagni_04500 [Golovinomyces magnicellulatus]
MSDQFPEQTEFIPWNLKEASIGVYKEESISGRELHALWSIDFEFFSTVEYKKAILQTRTLRDFLRARNLFVLKTGQSIATELLKAKQAQWEPMPSEYQHEVF